MSERPTDWINQPEVDLFVKTGSKKGKKKKGGGRRSRDVFSSYDPPDPALSVSGGTVSGPGIAGATKSKKMGSGNDMYTPPSSMTSGGPSTGLGTGTVDNAPVNPAKYDAAVGAVTNKAYPGSLASTIGDQSQLPVSNDPFSLINHYYMSQGMDANSNMSRLAFDMWNPMDKQFGIMGGQGMGNPSDMINFGASLVERFSSGHGESLNGVEMVKTALRALDQAFKNPGASGPIGNTLTLIANDPDPASQTRSILGILQGILSGTMPGDSAAAFYDQLKDQAERSAYAYHKSGNPMGEERGGKNIASAMLQWLEGAF